MTHMRSFGEQNICLEVAGRTMQVVSYFSEQDIQRRKLALGSISVQFSVSSREVYSYVFQTNPAPQSGHRMMARYHPPQGRGDTHACPSFHPVILPPAPGTSGKAVSQCETAADGARGYNKPIAHTRGCQYMHSRDKSSETIGGR
jgi:hypothetical protein